MSILERIFEKIGKGVAYRPWLWLFLSTLLAGGLASGFFTLVTENRPEKQWVPAGSSSLLHKDHADKNYKSSLRFGSFIATCLEGTECNLLEADYIRELDRIIAKVNMVEVDGDEVRKTLGLETAVTDAEWEKLDGLWTYDGSKDGTEAKCFQAGPTCLGESVLSVFRDEDSTLAGLTDATALEAMNNYQDLEIFCPLSVARLDSPCINATASYATAGEKDCAVVNPSMTQRINCKTSMDNYCTKVCPKDDESCKDEGCNRSMWYRISLLVTPPTEDPTLPFTPRKVKSWASSGKSGPALAPDGSLLSAKALLGSFFLAETPLVVAGTESDPIAEEWEKRALCALGVIADPDDPTPGGMTCEKSELMDVRAFFSRSLGDEFGSAIRGDIGALGSSYIVVLVYMIIMLSRRDTVHSMIAVGFVTVLIIGYSYLGCMGFGGYMGLPNNNLNSNIPFLLLGLGVDDAFVLVSEYELYFKNNPKSTPEERVVASAKYGGVSILITSLTDALAFLIGSSTVLPALSWFCQFAGVGVILCFIFQITVFLPALVLNGRRTDANRLDCLCCVKAKTKHEFAAPQGCCFCCKCKPDILENICGKFGSQISRGWPRIVTFILFAGLAGMGIAGSTKAYKDFKLEWFIPDDSYVNEYYALNDEYFAQGTSFAVYTQEMDYFKYQENMYDLQTMLDKSIYVDHSESVGNWHYQFVRMAVDNDMMEKLTENKKAYKNSDDYYSELLGWFLGLDGWGAGTALRGNVKWQDSACDNITRDEHLVKPCNYKAGIRISKVPATLALAMTNQGSQRYDTMVGMRSDVISAMDLNIPAVKQPFPYSREFLYWEEVGIIDEELVRNLLVAGAVITVIVCMMIPHPRIAFFVILGIALTIVELIGYLYWWDVTISSISTIYILISVGLAVDYSAHIAHMFVVSKGTPQMRVVEAMSRIGPSVFNGITSTMLAVVVLSLSKSYIFRVFFKALFLTVGIGGLHGLWLLPAVLSVFGGANGAGSVSPLPDKHVELVKVGDKQDPELPTDAGTKNNSESK